MTIGAVGGMSSAELVAYLALQSGEDDKKTHDAERRADEEVQHNEEQKELSSMQDQAIDTLVTSVGTAVIEGASSVTTLSHPKWSDAVREGVSTGFKAAETASKGVGDGMVQFAKTDATAHGINAERAKADADDCKSSSARAQQVVGQAIDAARSITMSEAQVALDVSKRV